MASETTEASPLVSPHSSRIRNETRKKDAAAAIAAGWVKEGDVVFLDSSTTILHLARKLQKVPLQKLTVVTNSVSIIQDFHRFPRDFVLVALGGSYNAKLNALLGKTTSGQLAGIRIAKAFVSAVGISSEGSVTTYHEEHAAFLSLVLARSSRTFLVLDSTKFGRVGLYEFAEPGSFAGLASDSPPPREIARNLKLKNPSSKKE